MLTKFSTVDDKILVKCGRHTLRQNSLTKHWNVLQWWFFDVSMRLHLKTSLKYFCV